MIQEKTMVLILGAVAFSALGQLFRRPHVVGMVLIIIGVACVLSGD